MLQNAIFAIIGTTGVGKSAFAVELAKKVNGEIINADSMQVYKGLDIVTNKVTEEEMQQIPHHLLSFVDPLNTDYSIFDFERDALTMIQDIHNRQKTPILVGGTHYYLQAILWKSQLLKDQVFIEEKTELQTEVEKLLQKYPIEQVDAMEDKSAVYLEFHASLAKIDAKMAAKLHPNSDRKIRRNLEIFVQTGRIQTDIVNEMSNSIQTPRFPVCVFWLNAQQEILDQRLDERVETMIQRGLFKELLDMSKLLVNKTSSYGIMQAIGISVNFDALGFKEFKDYLSSLDNDSLDLDKLKVQAIDKMKIATRQYAKKQVRWIKNKLAPTLFKTQSHSPTECAFFMLDATDLKSWNTEVSEKGITLGTAFLSQKELPDPYTTSARAMLVLKDAKKPDIQWNRYSCPLCSTDGANKTVHGDHEWRAHIGSRGHKRKAEKQGIYKIEPIIL